MGRHEVGFLKNTRRDPINGGKGCLFITNFHIAKVPGNFHVSTHSSQEQPNNPDFAHEVIDLTFGEGGAAQNHLPDTINSRAFNALRGHKTGDKVVKGSSFDYTLREET